MGIFCVKVMIARELITKAILIVFETGIQSRTLPEVSRLGSFLSEYRSKYAWVFPNSNFASLALFP
ncbi:MAG: hypothetical protein CVU11_03580 [Bacteroidetes bacterium HGW-Bacteroidetes-6]|nr:MAG: hypothetical protein CVU11_03580 [Bacteroidetes bacterium HGW-Bacteroidetes-6]